MSGLQPAAAGQLLAVTVRGARLGLPAGLIREVTRLPRLTRIPRAPVTLLGLANIRGTVVPVLSLAALTGRAGGTEQRLLVLKNREPIGIAVDGVAGLMAADGAAAVEPIDAIALAAGAFFGDRGRARAIVGGSGAEAIPAEATDQVALVTFAVGSQTFALPLDAVEEVLRLPNDIAAVPNGGVVALGSIDVRGVLLPLLRLSELLALSGKEASTRSRVVVARIGAYRVGLVIDGPCSVLRVAERDIDAVPLVLTRGDAEARIQAVCRAGGGKLVSVLAPRHLLREDITARLMLSTPIGQTEAGDEPTRRFLLFDIGDRAFGLPVEAVERVARLPDSLARAPTSPDFVRGIMSLRGAAIAVIDQAERFGSPSAARRQQRVIIVRIGALRGGFLVDAVPRIRSVAVSALQTPPLPGEEARLFGHVLAESDDRPLRLILDPGELLDGTERDMLRAWSAKAMAPDP